jgi:predicted transcriptional regulator
MKQRKNEPMPNKLTAYHQNFIKGVKMIMAVANLDSTKAAAEHIGIPYMAMWKIMDGTNKPTVDNCIKLIKKGKFNANWLFMNTGEIYYKQQISLDNILTELQSIKRKFHNGIKH